MVTTCMPLLAHERSVVQRFTRCHCALPTNRTSGIRTRKVANRKKESHVALKHNAIAVFTVRASLHISYKYWNKAVHNAHDIALRVQDAHCARVKASMRLSRGPRIKLSKS